MKNHGNGNGKSGGMIDSSEDDDDDLSILLAKSNASKLPPRSTDANKNRNNHRSELTSKSHNDNDDELDLIEPVDDKRHKLIKKHRLLRTSLAEKSETLKDHQQLINQLVQQLTKELNDNGTTISSKHIANQRLIIDHLLKQSKDILSYNRNFYFFDQIPENFNDQIDLHLASLMPGDIPTPKMVLDGFKYTNRAYLQKLNGLLHGKVMEILNGALSISVVPVDKVSFDLRDDHFGIISSQLHDRCLQVKLDHYNPSPDLNLLRVRLLLNIYLLGNYHDEWYNCCNFTLHNFERIRNQKDFYQLLYKILLLTMNDANLMKNNYEELLEFTRMVFLGSKDAKLWDHLSSFDKLSHIKIYGQSRELELLNYHYGLQYNVLNLLSIVSNSQHHGISDCDGISQDIKNLNKEWLGINEEFSLENYFQSILELTYINVETIFANVDYINQFYRIHYGLRLLNYVITFTIDPVTLKLLVDILSTLKSRYHKLMGDVSFSNAEDPFTVKSAIVQILNDDYNYLAYYHTKFSKYLKSISNDFFYE